MALVDYSSDSDSDSDLDPGPDASNDSLPAASPAEVKAGTCDVTTVAPSAKRRKVSQAQSSKTTTSSLPPLPPSFHDLYASTVRVSTNDDPTLHQGRKRVNPHRVGNWPTHIYIEWHPTTAQRALLASLIEKTQASVVSPSTTEILSFLNSDLGAPQPLHISLSRPIVLSTSQRDGFLEQLAATIRKSGIQPFELAPRALSWHRTAESARSFLVLRVASSNSSSSSSSTTTTSNARSISIGGGGGGVVAGDAARAVRSSSGNPELADLLGRCNRLVTEYGQPPLYAHKVLEGSRTALEDAFHVSVAWSFAEVDGDDDDDDDDSSDLRQRTEEVFSEPALRGGVLDMRLHVDGIKVKVGNAVTHVALPVRGGGGGVQK